MAPKIVPVSIPNKRPAVAPALAAISGSKTKLLESDGPLAASPNTAPTAAPVIAPNAIPLNTGLIFLATLNPLITSTETVWDPLFLVIYKVLPTRLSNERATRGFLVINRILYFLAFNTGYTVAGLLGEVVWAKRADCKKIADTMINRKCFTILMIGFRLEKNTVFIRLKDSGTKNGLAVRDKLKVAII